MEDIDPMLAVQSLIQASSKIVQNNGGKQKGKLKEKWFCGSVSEWFSCGCGGVCWLSRRESERVNGSWCGVRRDGWMNECWFWYGSRIIYMIRSSPTFLLSLSKLDSIFIIFCAFEYFSQSNKQCMCIVSLCTLRT